MSTYKVVQKKNESRMASALIFWDTDVFSIRHSTKALSFLELEENTMKNNLTTNFKFRKTWIFTYEVIALYQQSLCSWDKDKIDGLSLMDMESF